MTPPTHNEARLGARIKRHLVAALTRCVQKMRLTHTRARSNPTATHKSTPMTPRAHALDQLLTSLRHTRPPQDTLAHRPHLQREPYRGDYAMFEPLRQRGWTVHFDGEGDFFEPDAHARLARVFFDVALPDTTLHLRDTFIPRKGWVLEAWDDQRWLARHTLYDREHPSDWAELDLILATAHAWLSQDQLIVDFITGDQCALCAVMPTGVYHALVDAGFIEEREDGLYPTPDHLVCELVDDLRAPRNMPVHTLTRAQVQALRDDAHPDWRA